MKKDEPNIYGFIDSAMHTAENRYKIPASVNATGAMREQLNFLWRALGRLEYRFFKQDLDALPIDRPVYVSGLARSGTTILLETLYSSGLFASHRYSDYPFVDFILIWRFWMNLVAKTEEKLERAHMDRLEITSGSPEALEEMVWMAFFDHIHDPETNNCLGPSDRRKNFDEFYPAHIRKLLFQEKKKRYLAKGNYNLTRLPYIKSLYPDAKFVIAVRRPENHIASLMKQHYLFSRLEKKDERIKNYMNRIGHFEFGLNRTPLNVGSEVRIDRVVTAWKKGRELEGWALYWDMIYRFVYEEILTDPDLRDSVYLVRYEDLCGKTQPVLNELASFCGLESENPFVQAPAISAPDYYRSGFTAEQSALIKSITAEMEDLYYKSPQGAAL